MLQAASYGLAYRAKPLARAAGHGWIDRGDLTAWVQTMSSEFTKLRDAAANGRATLQDTYGATNPAEFFAVATECFFEKGKKLLARHAELYANLRDYYQQDPATHD